jgi:hypothetical protein
MLAFGHANVDAAPMQFDFLKRLFGKRERPVAREMSPVPAEVKAVIVPHEPLLDEARELLRGVGASALAERVRIEWNPRMRSTAGLAYPGRALVRQNPKLRDFCDQENHRTQRH